MTSPRDESIDPKPLDAEREALLETARFLERSRPTPRREFTRALTARLQRNLEEWKNLHETAGFLKRTRPAPTAEFRDQLAIRLSGRFATPERLRLLIGAYAGSGLLLLTIVVLGLAGAGPLASA
jgi:hypothetical protein